MAILPKIFETFEKRAPGRKLEGRNPRACLGESRAGRSNNFNVNLCTLCISQTWPTTKS